MPKNEQAGTLVEKIEKSIQRLEDVVLHKQDSTRDMIISVVIATLKEVSTNLSRPLDDGELERIYRNALKDAENMSYLHKHKEIVNLKDAVTALHDALSRKQAEVERLTEELNKCWICKGEGRFNDHLCEQCYGSGQQPKESQHE